MFLWSSVKTNIYIYILCSVQRSVFNEGIIWSQPYVIKKSCQKIKQLTNRLFGNVFVFILQTIILHHIELVQYVLEWQYKYKHENSCVSGAKIQTLTVAQSYHQTIHLHTHILVYTYMREGNFYLGIIHL